MPEEASREARRLLCLDLRNGGLRILPIRGRGEGRCSCRARADCGPLGLDVCPELAFTGHLAD
eukprot:13345991-Alexandrium_andersonii.AAC.1